MSIKVANLTLDVLLSYVSVLLKIWLIIFSLLRSVICVEAQIEVADVIK